MTFLWAEWINQNKQRLTVRVLREQMKWKSGMSVLYGMLSGDMHYWGLGC
jgi:hypothetical protein